MPHIADGDEAHRRTRSRFDEASIAVILLIVNAAGIVSLLDMV